MTQLQNNRAPVTLRQTAGSVRSALAGAVTRMPLLRSRAAPVYRRLVRALVVLVGLAIFGIVELATARAINAGLFYLIIVLAGVSVATVLVLWSPALGFLYWLFFSPFARHFIRTFTVFHIGFDVVMLGLLVTALVFRALAQRRRPSALILPEWLLILSLIYAVLLRNTESLTTPGMLRQVVLTPVVVYFIARSAIVKKEHISWLILTVMFVGTTWALLGIYEQFAGRSWLSPLVGFTVQARGELMGTGHRSVGPAGHYYLYGNVIILATLFAIHWAGWTRKPIAKVLCYSLCPVLLLGLYYGYSRAPYMAFVLAVLLVLSLSRASFKRYLAVAISLIVVVALAVPYWLADKELRNRLEASPSSRLATNATSMNMIRTHPFFGIGLNKYTDMVPKYVSSREHSYMQPSRYAVISYWGRPHSEYLLVLSEQGIVGVLLYFGCFLAFILKVFRVRSRLNREGFMGQELVGVVIAFTFGVLLTMVTDEFQLWPYMYFVMFSMFAAVVRLDELTTEQRAARAQQEDHQNPALAAGTIST